MRGIVVGAILSVGHLFAGWSYNWEAYIADPANVTPWDELDATLVQAKYWENFSGRAPYGLGKVAPFKDQWIVRWNPSVMGSLMIIK